MIFLLFIVFFWIFAETRCFSNPISAEQAGTAVRRWVEDGSGTIEETLGQTVKTIKRYDGEKSGNIGYYLVILNPAGWAVVPADDRFWPVPLFGSGKMTPELFENTVWYDALNFSGEPEHNVFASQNYSSTSSGVRNTQKNKKITDNKQRWGKLLGSNYPPFRTASVSLDVDITVFPKYDIRVAPLISNEKYWVQGWPFNKLLSFNQLVAYNPASANLVKSPDVPFPVGCYGLSKAQLMSAILSNSKLYPNSLRTSIKTKTSVYNSLYNNITSKDIHGNYNLINIPLLKEHYDWEAIHDCFSGYDGTNSVDFYPVVSDEIAPLLRDIAILSNHDYTAGLEDPDFSGTGIHTRSDDLVLKQLGFENAISLYTTAHGYTSFDYENLESMINPNYAFRIFHICN
ncbi:MAG: hypothetical protein LBS55_08560 [Prevotellaceae bacterium]|nr:hypothetical protein [Prevotellaceae bacterium]